MAIREMAHGAVLLVCRLRSLSAALATVGFLAVVTVGIASSASAASLPSGVSSSDLVTQIGATAMQSVLATSTPTAPITTAEIERLRTLPASEMTVGDALSLADVIEQAAPTAQGTGTSTPVALAPAIGGSTPISATTPGGAPTLSGSLVAASSGTCWEGTINNIVFSAPVVGATFSVGVGPTGWCEGPGGTAIVSVGTWEFPKTADFPGVCISSNNDYHQGEGTWSGGYSSMMHGLHTIGVGVGISGFCEGVRSVSAAIRDWYDGYYDCYNDWGFGGNYGCGTITFRQGPY